MPNVFHMVTYVPILEAEQFYAGQLSTVSAPTGLNWFLLSLQTAKPLIKKKILLFSSSRFSDMMMSTALKNTRR